MKKISIAVAFFAALVFVLDAGAWRSAGAQPALPKLLSEEEIAKQAANKPPAGLPRRPQPAPNAMARPAGAKAANPVALGGPVGVKKNPVISGQGKSQKNAASIAGSDTRHRQN